MFSFDNFHRPDNKRWKKAADYILYTGLPAINMFLAATQPISPHFTIWSMAVSNLLIALFKGLTKYTAEPEQPGI
jgi:hypothetical protein